MHLDMQQVQRLSFNVLGTYRQDHGIAKDLYQILVHEAHVSGSEESNVLWTI